MDSCGVGAFSLNYGPQSMRGKSPYAPDPRQSRIVPTTRDRYCPAPHTWQLSDNCAAKVPHSESIDHIEKEFTSRTASNSIPNAISHLRPASRDTTVASCNIVRDSHESLSISVAHRAFGSLSSKTH
jgi:hypothetical protein